MKKATYVLGAIASTFLMLIGIVLFAGGIAEKIISMAVVGLILFAISFVIIISIGKKNAQNRKHKTQMNITDKNLSPKLTYSEKLLQNREKMYRKMKYKLTFISGLPLMQGTLCKVISTFDKIVIEGQGTTFELAKEKITSITIEKNITNHTQAVSSAGGAIAGAMAFGVVGAAIGGRTVAKDVKSKKYYLVITYFDNDENVKYIVFDNNNKAPYLVEDFKIFNKDNVVKKVVEIN